MPTRKGSPQVNTGRKAAYVARNRTALLQSTQRILAEIGPEATIDQISEIANVSVSTIYQHFENKEILFSTAIIEGMREWEFWSDETLGYLEDPLEELVFPMRLFLRIKGTHPLYAEMIAKNLSAIPRYVPALSSGLSQHIKELVKSKVIEIDAPEIRIQSVSACIFAALSHQLLNPKAKESEADLAIEIALGILGLTSAKAKKLANAPLPHLDSLK
jgi:AcrR family transcriptional regulator